MCVSDRCLSSRVLNGPCRADNLVSDNKELCKLAFERGSLAKLAWLVKSITPTEKTAEWEEDEPESRSCLREVRVFISSQNIYIDANWCSFSVGSFDRHRGDIALRRRYPVRGDRYAAADPRNSSFARVSARRRALCRMPMRACIKSFCGGVANEHS